MLIPTPAMMSIFFGKLAYIVLKMNLVIDWCVIIAVI
jgi:hypothetical protein